MAREQATAQKRGFNPVPGIVKKAKWRWTTIDERKQ